MWFEEGRQSGVVRCTLATDLGQQEQHLPARASKSAKEAHTAKIESTRRKYEAQRSRLLRANPSFTDLKTRDAARLAIQERKLQLVSGVPPQGWHPLPNVVEEDAGELPALDNAGPGGSGGPGQHGRAQGTAEGGAQGARVPAGSDLETLVDNGGYNQLARTIIGNIETQPAHGVAPTQAAATAWPAPRPPAAVRPEAPQQAGIVVARHASPPPHLSNTPLQRALGQATTGGLLAADLTAAPGLLGPFSDMLSLAADREDVLDAVPVWGSMFKAAGGQRLASDQSAFNSHANRAVNHNIAAAQAAAAEFDGTQDPEARAQLAVQVAQHYKTASEAQQTQKQLNDMSQLLPYKEVIRLARDGDPRKTSLVACLASLSSEQRAYLGAALTGQTQSASRPSSKRPFAATLPPEGGPQEGPEDITCLICNQRGHRFRNCPQLQAMPRDQQQAAVDKARARLRAGARGAPASA
ncbi:hypothetical protein VOLCADRAFT_85797 [Volvox carteri f. nagariensis]|uniref:CCHC-type domain-containing protein n=1 Tax=Volvox carteri f. nagariensis TaxID=3068 RepID=D8TH05_VOLCA|nr:uncharacterized protein VOLCADRAFT_85797 [Volvox carteri f. nagariensis]EFJ52627.1 hypothetical protein VOLCADRAFT_85797 [Volvox carteri f. nagariensis]|eukprot:XP_002945632.1 hypothetical protein VOLCADRAFT_85797 [Volvox carteri f. nagariensis]